MSLASKFPYRVRGEYIHTYQLNADGRYLNYGTYVDSWRTNHWYSSVKTSNYKSILNRDLPVNTFQAGNRWYERKVGYGSHPNGDRREGVVDYWYPNLYYASSANGNVNTTPAKSAAEQRALSDAKEMKFNAAQAWAERKQTANFLASQVQRFASAALAMKKGNFKRCADLLEPWAPGLFQKGSVARRKPKPPEKDDFANWWLEYHYGFIPLMSDIYGAAEMLSQAFNEPRPLGVRARIKLVDVIPERSYSQGIAYKTTTTMRAECQLKFDISNEVLQTLSKTGITNPLLLAWELVPLSFVGDWFIPVGSYLSKLDATLGLQFRSGSTTVVSDQVDTARISGPLPDGYVFLGGDYLRRTFILDRYKLNTFPGVQLPSIRNVFNVNKAVTSLALINQLFR